jgi:hypothetical protein
VNISETQLKINDYLDLYLYAKRIDDPLWQEEIIEKLQYTHIRKGVQSCSLKNQIDK